MRTRCSMPGRIWRPCCRALEVSEATLQRWRNQYGGMKAEEAVRLKKLEDENKRLKQVGGRSDAGHPDAEVRRGGKLVSPSRKRAAAVKLQEEFAVSERRACRVLDQPRSKSALRRRKPRDDEAALVKRMLELVRQRPRFGYRRITAQLRAGGLACRTRNAGLSAVASGRTESAAKEAKTATFGHERERLPSPAGGAQGPRLVLGLRLRSDRRAAAR